MRICKQNYIKIKYILSNVWFFKIEIKWFLQLSNFESGGGLVSQKQIYINKLNVDKTIETMPDLIWFACIFKSTNLVTNSFLETKENGLTPLSK